MALLLANRDRQAMPESDENKVVINLATGLEDPERATVAAGNGRGGALRRLPVLVNNAVLS